MNDFTEKKEAILEGLSNLLDSIEKKGPGNIDPESNVITNIGYIVLDRHDLPVRDDIKKSIFQNYGSASKVVPVGGSIQRIYAYWPRSKQ